METINIESKVPKEAKEVIDFIDGLLEDILNKKDISALAAENLPALMEAINGYEEVLEGFSGEHRATMVSYMVSVLMSRLMPYKEPKVEAAVKE